MNLRILAKRFKRIFLDDSEPVDMVHNYWNAPDDENNQPEKYIAGEEKSKYLLSKLSELDRDASILEMGTNVGRNLNQLYQAGFRNLSGIEISHNAIELMKKQFPEMYAESTIIHSSLEDFLKENNQTYDLIFSIAVMEHIHSDSNWIFNKIAAAASQIITIEDEISISWKHFPRNYKRIYENLGLRQIDMEDAQRVPHLHKGFFYRRFIKQ